MHAKDALGRLGEDLALAHLQAQGMQLVTRNWRCDVGEVDLILRDQRTLVFCEVKTRSSLRFGHPLEAVTAPKLDRLHRLAIRYLQTTSQRGVPVRIDVVGVLGNDTAARVWHVRSAA
jgi:putative endonuclease